MMILKDVDQWKTKKIKRRTRRTFPLCPYDYPNVPVHEKTSATPSSIRLASKTYPLNSPELWQKSTLPDLEAIPAFIPTKVRSDFFLVPLAWLRLNQHFLLSRLILMAISHGHLICSLVIIFVFVARFQRTEWGYWPSEWSLALHFVRRHPTCTGLELNSTSTFR